MIEKNGKITELHKSIQIGNTFIKIAFTLHTYILCQYVCINVYQLVEHTHTHTHSFEREIQELTIR